MPTAAVRRSAAVLAPAPDFFLPDVAPAVEQLHTATALYTRDPVVDQILTLADWPSTDGRVLDAGCGSGQFLISAVARLTMAPNDIDGLVARIQAWEIHPVAADTARTRLAQLLLARGWDRAAAELAATRVVITADFLAPGPVAERFDYIVGNPPYARLAGLPDVFKALYARVVPDYARGDLLHAFLDSCTKLLADDGRLAWVIADRPLFNENAARLREVVGQRFSIASSERLDSASTFYRPKQRRAGSPPRVHPVALLLAPNGSAEGLTPLTRAPYYPGGAVTQAEGTVLLSEVATVRCAPWLGPHGVFIVDATDAPRFPGECVVPCVDTDDVRPDSTLGTPTRVAIRTQRDTLPHPAIRDHLDTSVEQLPPRARRTPHWLPPESWGPLPLEGEALLIPRIAKTLRVVRLPAGVLPINHNLAVVRTAPDVSLDALAAALSSEECQQWIQQHAPRLENGYLSITTTLLRRLPVRLDGRCGAGDDVA